MKPTYRKSFAANLLMWSDLQNAVCLQNYVSWPFLMNASCIWPQMCPWPSLDIIKCKILKVQFLRYFQQVGLCC